MSDLHREKTGTSTQEDSRRLQEPPPERWDPSVIGQGGRPTLTGAAARGQRPIRFILMDPASTDFED